jgi:hypothetical protein
MPQAYGAVVTATLVKYATRTAAQVRDVAGCAGTASAHEPGANAEAQSCALPAEWRRRHAFERPPNIKGFAKLRRGATSGPKRRNLAGADY